MKNEVYKKRIVGVMMSLLVLLSIVCFPKNSDAETWTSLKDYPNIELVGDGLTPKRIPGDYSTMLRYKRGRVHKTVGASATATAYQTFNSSTSERVGGEHYVQIDKVAIFGGNYVDLRINVEDLTGSGRIQIYTPTGASGTDFLRINIRTQGTQAKLRFEYYISGTNIKAHYSGMWNYERVNNRKSVAIPSDTNTLYSLYTHSNTELLYSLDSLPETGFVDVYGQNRGDTPEQQFTALFNTDGGDFTQYLTLRDSNVGYLEYGGNPITQMELPTPQVVGETNEEYPKVSYTVVQDVPVQLKTEYYPKDYKLYIDLIEEMDINSVKLDVTDVNGSNANSYFNFTKDVENHRIVATVSDANMSTSPFIDNAYEIKVEGNLTDRKTLEQYYKDQYYNIPAKVHYTTKDYNSNTNTGTAKTKAIIEATPKVYKVVKGTDTSNWINQPASDFFDNLEGAFTGDDLVIKSVEQKTFNTAGEGQSVSVVLKGSKSGVEKTFSVPVIVLDARKANINFIDKEGSKISDTIVKTGYETLEYDYSSEQKVIPNYRFLRVDETGDPVVGVYPTENKELNINFIYELDDQMVTTNYTDESGNLIAPKISERLKSGQSHDVKSQEIPGYKVKAVKVDGIEKSLTDEKGVTIAVSDKSVNVEFIYESVHFSLLMTSSSPTVVQRDTIDYSLDIKSGMLYGNEKNPDNYNNVKITIPVDSNLTNVQKISVKDKSGEVIGIGQYNESSNQIVLSLTSQVKNTEDIYVKYSADVKAEAVTDTNIQTKATMSADYTVNGEVLTITKNSNELINVIGGGLRLLSAPSTIDFGKVVFYAKDLTIDNPTIDKGLVVSDTRTTENTGWSMTAQMIQPLKTDSDLILDGSIVYKNNDSEVLLGADSVEIYTDMSKKQKEVDITENWGTDISSQGLKLKFKSNDLPKSAVYTGTIRWNLMPGQP